MTTDNSTLIHEVLECIHTLNDLASLTPVDDPNHRLLNLVAEKQEKTLLQVAKALHEIIPVNQ